MSHFTNRVLLYTRIHAVLTSAYTNRQITAKLLQMEDLSIKMSKKQSISFNQVSFKRNMVPNKFLSYIHLVENLAFNQLFKLFKEDYD